MGFRTDINGLRAIAVISVVLFHFNAAWLPGGFAGVDVFFVISGFLMTGIIFKGLENSSFSVMHFYLSRANRIIPALAVLCLILLALGWFYLAPLQYKELGKHTASSIGFISNIIYWKESGYFDASSHEKWLLHTWSLSVEWQFYIIYPLVLVAMKRFMSVQVMKWIILAGSVIGFVFCVVATYKWANPSYYLLPARAWEMMVGGVAYLFPFDFKEKTKIKLETLGVALILISCAFISEDYLWPGYLALVPVLGAFLIIHTNRNSSLLTSNFIMQKIGLWSYSIYLWHWPIVVALYTFNNKDHSYIYFGISLSIFLGFLSYRFVECKFKNIGEIKFKALFTNKPVIMACLIASISVIIFFYNGLSIRPSLDSNLITITSNIKPSPFRSHCHTSGSKYREPKDACTYHNENVTWATIGDSHTVELAYALADSIDKSNEGIKHFSYSGCIPSYGQPKEFSECAEWTNESFDEIVRNKTIKNVLINYRYSAALYGDNESSYPSLPNKNTEHKRTLILQSINQLIFDLAKVKSYVFVFMPIPELGLSVSNRLSKEFITGGSITNVKGVNVSYYDNRNGHILNHFKSTIYPDNVVFIDPTVSFCDEYICYAVKNGVPLYFDDDHPSVEGAKLLINELMIAKNLKSKSFARID